MIKSVIKNSSTSVLFWKLDTVNNQLDFNINMLSTTKKSELLTFQELSILKSLTLNLSCKEIQGLLKINKDSYETTCATLFKKLGASNSYFAVKNAFEMKLLNKKDCTAEELKSFSLEYAYMSTLEKIIM